MASYQIRHRDPFLNAQAQALLSRRGREALGLLLVVLAVAVAAMLASYRPDDSSWLAATDAPAANLLGRTGASIASPLMIVIGLAAWGLVPLLAIWGGRHLAHRGAERALSRVVFAPIALALGAVFASTLTPGADWPHSFGLGGLFGDTVLGAVLGVAPVTASFGLRLLSVAVLAAMVALALYVLGLDRREMRLLARFLLLGLVAVYAGGVALAGLGARLALRGVRAGLGAGAAAWAARRSSIRAAATSVRAAVPPVPVPVPVPAPAGMPVPLAVPAPAAQRAGTPAALPERPRILSNRAEPPVVRPAPPRQTPAAPPVLAPAPRPAGGTAQAAPTPERPFRSTAILRPPETAVTPETVALPAAPAVAAAPGPAGASGAEGGPARGAGYLSRVPPVVRPAADATGARPSGPVPSAPAEPVPELVEPLPPAGAEAAAAAGGGPSEARVRAKIADLIRLRATRGAARPAAAGPAGRRDPPLARDRRPPPLIADTGRTAPAAPAAPAAVAVPAASPSVLSAPLSAVAAAARSVFGHRPAATAAPDLPAAPALPEAPVPADPPAAEALPGSLRAVSTFIARAAPAAAPPVPAHDPLAAGGAGGAADAGEEGAGEDWPDLAAAFQPPLSAEVRRVVQPAPRRPAPSRKAQAEAQPRLLLDDPPPVYDPPPLSLLSNSVGQSRPQLSDSALAENARMLESVLDDYGVKGEIVSVRPGPVVTLYELEPAPGLKASRVIGLADDIARSMSALSARVSTVPGRSVIGIELPNAHREKVLLREILAARDFGDSQLRLPLALGKDIAGVPVVANLAKMPHLLIAGTTGSGKSVAINTMILSLLYKLSPEECRLIMIDPKMLELSVYDGIPHLLSPVVTDPRKAVVALKWVVSEMEERYRKMSKMGVRNIEGYNGRVREALARGEMFRRTIQTGFDEETGDPVYETEEFAPVAIPYIVVIVDEMADLMMVAGKEIEACIQRLAQMARASGIHLIMATQRPSVDVITGTIKANFPTRISFQVTSKIDSRTILGEQGAEQLLGMGDMLYMAGGARITRIHGPFVSDEEVEEIVNHLKSYGPPAYVAGVLEGPEEERESEVETALGLGGEGADEGLYDQAVAIVARDRKCSTSYIQRKLGIGYNKAARLVEQMEEAGVVSAANHVGKREVLVPEP